MDTALRPGFDQITENEIGLKYVNLPPLVQSIQVYDPTINSAWVSGWITRLLNSAMNIPGYAGDLLADTLHELQNTGVTPFIANAVADANNAAGAYGSTAIAKYAENYPGAAALRARLGQKFSSEVSGGLGNSGCASANMAAFGAGVAFAVLAVMSGGLAPVAGGVLLLEGWGAIAAWGGLGATLWGVGTSMVCDF